MTLAVSDTIKGTIKLRLLLWYIARKLQQVNKCSEEFRSTINGRNFVLQIGGQNHYCVRHFKICQGAISSEPTSCVAPDLNIQFKNAEEGFELLFNGSQTAFMYALQQEKVTMHGDPSLLFWFAGIAHFLKPRKLRKP